MRGTPVHPSANLAHLNPPKDFAAFRARTVANDAERVRCVGTVRTNHLQSNAKAAAAEADANFPHMRTADLATLSRSGGNAGAWDIDDDRRFDDDRSHDPRQKLRVLQADIPGRAAQSWLSCRPWFSLCRERHFHTGASRPGCTPAVPHRCPGRPHWSNKQVHPQTMQARKPTGKYACGYLIFESDARTVSVRSVQARCGCPARFVANVSR
jgi:hypothetical protein